MTATTVEQNQRLIHGVVCTPENPQDYDHLYKNDQLHFLEQDLFFLLEMSSDTIHRNWCMHKLDSYDYDLLVRLVEYARLEGWSNLQETIYNAYESITKFREGLEDFNKTHSNLDLSILITNPFIQGCVDMKITETEFRVFQCEIEVEGMFALRLFDKTSQEKVIQADLDVDEHGNLTVVNYESNISEEVSFLNEIYAELIQYLVEHTRNFKKLFFQNTDTTEDEGWSLDENEALENYLESYYRLEIDAQTGYSFIQMGG